MVIKIYATKNTRKIALIEDFIIVTDVESSMKFVKINLDGIKDSLILAVQKLSRELDALDKNDMNARSELLRTNVKAQLNIFYRQSQQQMN